MYHADINYKATYYKEPNGTYTVNAPTKIEKGFDSKEDAKVYCESYGSIDNRDK